MTTADKYWYIINHPFFINNEHLIPRIDIEPHNVCPSTNKIERYDYLNTKVQYWIEFMAPYFDQKDSSYILAHYWKHDCGGDSIDEAIDILYNSIIGEYGTYTQEELDAREALVYGYNNISVLEPWDNIHEEYFDIKGDIITEETTLGHSTVGDFKEKIEEEENLKKALLKYKESANIDEYSKIDSDIQNVEHNIWVYNESIRVGMNLDL